MTTPNRGDLIIANLNPQAGTEQKKRRPALVQNGFEIPLPSGLRFKGSVLVHQVRALDWRARRAESAGRAPDDLVGRVADIVKEIVS